MASEKWPRPPGGLGTEGGPGESGWYQLDSRAYRPPEDRRPNGSRPGDSRRAIDPRYLSAPRQSPRPEYPQRQPAPQNPRGASQGAGPRRTGPISTGPIRTDPIRTGPTHTGPIHPGPVLAIEPPRPVSAVPARAPNPGSRPAARWPGENTRAAHLPPPRAPTRTGHPTVEAFCFAVAALEGAQLNYQVATEGFASGLAALSAVCWTFAGTGAHVLAPATVCGDRYGFLRNVAGRFGVRTDFVDMADPGQVRAAMRQGTAIVLAETISNPTLAVSDLAGLARLAHGAGALLVVDSTLAPPVICRPLELGADLVLHSASTYFGGHSDVTAGVVTGHPELINAVRRVRIDTGGSLAAAEAYLLHRGLGTLPLRVRRQCSTAQFLAASLVRHPAVRAVHYPGLPEDPGHEVARRQFDAGPEGTRFGAVLTVAPYGGFEAGLTFADRLRLAHISTSLGSTRTTASHVASTTHRQLEPAALAAVGIDPGSVRVSVGLEDGEDLLVDAMAALDSLGAGRRT